MAKIKDKNDAANISNRKGAEWYHFCKNEFNDFNELIKRR